MWGLLRAAIRAWRELGSRGEAVALQCCLAVKLRLALIFELSMRRKSMMQQRNFDIRDMF
jgi:hypothetical protein